MGYYSNVTLCLTKEGKDKLTVELERAKKDDPEHFADINDLFDAPAREDVRSGAVVFIRDNTRWYEDHAEVIFTENLMSNLDRKDYYFVRVGEDSDDEDVRGDFFANPFGMHI